MSARKKGYENFYISGWSSSDDEDDGYFGGDSSNKNHRPFIDSILRRTSYPPSACVKRPRKQNLTNHKPKRSKVQAIQQVVSLEDKSKDCDDESSNDSDDSSHIRRRLNQLLPIIPDEEQEPMDSLPQPFSSDEASNEEEPESSDSVKHHSDNDAEELNQTTPDESMGCSNNRMAPTKETEPTLQERHYDPVEDAGTSTAAKQPTPRRPAQDFGQPSNKIMTSTKSDEANEDAVATPNELSELDETPRRPAQDFGQPSNKIRTSTKPDEANEDAVAKISIAITTGKRKQSTTERITKDGRKRACYGSRNGIGKLPERRTFYIEDSCPHLSIVEGIEARGAWDSEDFGEEFLLNVLQDSHPSPSPGHAMELPVEACAGTWTAEIVRVPRSPSTKTSLMSLDHLKDFRLLLRHKSYSTLEFLPAYKAKNLDMKKGPSDEQGSPDQNRISSPTKNGSFLDISMFYPRRFRKASIERQNVVDLTKNPHSFIGSLSFTCLASSAFDDSRKLSPTILNFAKRPSFVATPETQLLLELSRPRELPTPSNWLSKKHWGVSFLCCLALDSDYHVLFAQETSNKDNKIVAIDVVFQSPTSAAEKSSSEGSATSTAEEAIGLTEKLLHSHADSSTSPSTLFHRLEWFTGASNNVADAIQAESKQDNGNGTKSANSATCNSGEEKLADIDQGVGKDMKPRSVGARAILSEDKDDYGSARATSKKSQTKFNQTEISHGGNFDGNPTAPPHVTPRLVTNTKTDQGSRENIETPVLATDMKLRKGPDDQTRVGNVKSGRPSSFQEGKHGATIDGGSSRRLFPDTEPTTNPNLDKIPKSQAQETSKQTTATVSKKPNNTILAKNTPKPSETQVQQTAPLISSRNSSQDMSQKEKSRGGEISPPPSKLPCRIDTPRPQASTRVDIPVTIPRAGHNMSLSTKRYRKSGHETVASKISKAITNVRAAQPSKEKSCITSSGSKTRKIGAAVNESSGSSNSRIIGRVVQGATPARFSADLRLTTSDTSRKSIPLDGEGASTDRQKPPKSSKPHDAAAAAAARFSAAPTPTAKDATREPVRLNGKESRISRPKSRKSSTPQDAAPARFEVDLPPTARNLTREPVRLNGKEARIARQKSHKNASNVTGIRGKLVQPKALPTASTVGAQHSTDASSRKQGTTRENIEELGSTHRQSRINCAMAENVTAHETAHTEIATENIVIHSLVSNARQQTTRAPLKVVCGGNSMRARGTFWKRVQFAILLLVLLIPQPTTFRSLLPPLPSRERSKQLCLSIADEIDKKTPIKKAFLLTPFQSSTNIKKKISKLLG